MPTNRTDAIRGTTGKVTVSTAQLTPEELKLAVRVLRNVLPTPPDRGLNLTAAERHALRAVIQLLSE
jgi:hypothetical protein